MGPRRAGRWLSLCVMLSLVALSQPAEPGCAACDAPGDGNFPRPGGTCLLHNGKTLENEGVVRSRPAPPASDRHIVRFHEYKPGREHRATLRALLGPEDADRGGTGATGGAVDATGTATAGQSGGIGGGRVRWRWVVRRNVANRLPTDFALLWAPAEDASHSAWAALARAPGVRGVHRDSRISSRRLQGTDHPAADAEAGQAHTGVDNEEPTVFNPRGRGRMRTHFSFGLGDDGNRGGNGSTPATSHGDGLRRRRLLKSTSVTDLLQAGEIWKDGHRGAGVKVGVFDTGVRLDHPHFSGRIKERTNWTHEDTLDDGLGHGTFVMGVIASADSECGGFAPEAELYAFRVFTNDQVSYTSWFLDAFNYALATKVHVINLSIGGPDYLDEPFVDKVTEVTSNGIVLVSAIGNDGPLWGTLNNPADAADVIGVGGIDYDGAIAPFSSRGMTTHALPGGYGRVKPDLVTFGKDVWGSRTQGGCRQLSGTSVASPVVAGAVALLASVVPPAQRARLVNPASLKQALVEGATRLAGPHMHEQGAGKMDLLASALVMQGYAPRASAVPAVVDLSTCPYAWPLCRTPVYAGGLPLLFNVTLLNGMGVTGKLASPPTWSPANEGGRLLDMSFDYPTVLWPWSGALGLYIRVRPEGASFAGVASGEVSLEVVSPPPVGDTTGADQRSRVVFQVIVAVEPTPPRAKRLLWDVYHSVRYPPGYIPRDSLDAAGDILDWHGDHPHTNYHGAFDALRDAGYHVEVLASPLTCMDASRYGALLLVDSEEEYHAEEISKLAEDVHARGLSLLVFADWYNVATMVSMKFFDDNTRSWWTPATGGANIPALNDLLAPFGAAFGDAVLQGEIAVGGRSTTVASGAEIIQLPEGAFAHVYVLAEKAPGSLGAPLDVMTAARRPGKAVLGVLPGDPGGRRGAVMLYGDSNCLDASHQISDCYWLLKDMLDVATSSLPGGGGESARDSSVLTADGAKLTAPLGLPTQKLPRRRTDVDFEELSRVKGRPPVCGRDAPRPLGVNDNVWAEATRATLQTPPPVSATDVDDTNGPAVDQGRSPAVHVPSPPLRLVSIGFESRFEALLGRLQRPGSTVGGGMSDVAGDVGDGTHPAHAAFQVYVFLLLILACAAAAVLGCAGCRRLGRHRRRPGLKA